MSRLSMMTLAIAGAYAKGCHIDENCGVNDYCFRNQCVPKGAAGAWCNSALPCAGGFGCGTDYKCAVDAAAKACRGLVGCGAQEFCQQGNCKSNMVKVGDWCPKAVTSCTGGACVNTKCIEKLEECGNCCMKDPVTMADASSCITDVTLANVDGSCCPETTHECCLTDPSKSGMAGNFLCCEAGKEKCAVDPFTKMGKCSVLLQVPNAICEKSCAGDTVVDQDHADGMCCPDEMSCCNSPLKPAGSWRCCDETVATCDQMKGECIPMVEECGDSECCLGAGKCAAVPEGRFDGSCCPGAKECCLYDEAMENTEGNFLCCATGSSCDRDPLSKLAHCALPKVNEGSAECFQKCDGSAAIDPERADGNCCPETTTCCNSPLKPEGAWQCCESTQSCNAASGMCA